MHSMNLKRAVLALIPFFIAAGCGGNDDGDGNTINSNGGSSSTGGASVDAGTGNSSSGGSSATGGSGTGGTSTGTGGTSTGTGGFGTVQACSGLPFEDAAGAGGEGGEACVGVGYEAEPVDIDMYIMMDRSVSMAEEVAAGTTRWDAVKAAVEEFVNTPEAAGVGVGIQFFGQSGFVDDDLDCDVSAYATPEVPIGLLPDVGEDIVNAIADTVPAGHTPTYSALKGAIEYAQGWAEDNVGRGTVVVLVTDGYPTQCQDPPSVSEIADLAAAAEAGNPRVLTFVIGIAAGFNLDAIARSGGTNSAYIVDDANVTDAFVSALLNITDSNIACEFAIPEPPNNSTEVDFDKVQVVYTPAVGDEEEVPRVNSVADCANSPNGGWYYDNTNAPSKISVCPCTCARFGAGQVDVRLGCKPRVIIR